MAMAIMGLFSKYPVVSYTKIELRAIKNPFSDYKASFKNMTATEGSVPCFFEFGGGFSVGL